MMASFIHNQNIFFINSYQVRSLNIECDIATVNLEARISNSYKHILNIIYII